MYRGWTQTDYQNKHYNINRKWLQRVQRMDTNRLPKQALQYKPKGRRNTGRPRKRWRDQLHLEDQGTGNTPNPSGTWWWWWRNYYHQWVEFWAVWILWTSLQPTSRECQTHFKSFLPSQLLSIQGRALHCVIRQLTSSSQERSRFREQLIVCCFELYGLDQLRVAGIFVRMQLWNTTTLSATSLMCHISVLEHTHCRSVEKCISFILKPLPPSQTVDIWCLGTTYS